MEERALAIVNPETNPEVIGMLAEAEGLLKYAEKRVIIVDEDVKSATVDLSMIAKLKRAMEETRRDYLKPFQDHVKEVNDAYKRLMSPVEEAEAITKRKILDYQKAQDTKRKAEEDINNLRMEAARKEAALNDGVISEPVALVEVTPETPKTVRTELGTTGRRKIRKWELVDKALVPEEYKILDSATITKVVKAGIPSIPGIRIYDEDILTVTPS